MSFPFFFELLIKSDCNRFIIKNENHFQIVDKAVKVKAQEQDDNKETQIIGSVGFRVYKSYFKSVNSEILLILVATLLICAQTAITFIDRYVSTW